MKKETNYGERVKGILDRLGEIAEKASDKYLKSNIPGLTKVSINAHELNALIVRMGEGGFHNKEIHSKIIITCARLLEAFEEAEDNERELQAKLKEEKEAEVKLKRAELDKEMKQSESKSSNKLKKVEDK